MDFARRQLEKYGWSDGKGLGKHENGISEALKPKLKRSVTGIGHDAAAEFNEHWWSALYDKAAKNVEIKDKNGKTKKIKTIDSENFTITNSTWRINKKHKNGSDVNEYSEYFIRKAVLSNDGTKVENVTDSETEDVDKKKDVFKMTDEDLFAACEGRTAHKGARHGLKALGKLARIAQQEEILLSQPKYEGYSHAKKIKHKTEQVFEAASLADNQEEKPKNKKKKKRKYCLSNENEDNIYGQAVLEVPSPNLKSKKNKKDNIAAKEYILEIKQNIETLAEDETTMDTHVKKIRKRKSHMLDQLESEINEDCIVPKKKKKKKRNIEKY